MAALFNTLFAGFAYLLAFFYSIIPNYAVAICALTLFFMVVTYPLTAKQTRNMIVMNRIQPELKRLQDLHKDDKQKYSEEVMALYKRHGINPLGGCVPMLLQFPLLICMFRVIEGLTQIKYPSGIAAGLKASVTALTTGTSVPIHAVPKHLSTGSKMFKDLQAAGGHMKAFGFDFAGKASDHSYTSAKMIPFAVLIALSILTQYISTKQIYARNQRMAQQNPQSQQMMRMQYFFMIFFAWIGLRFQAAVLLYWVASGALRIGQQSAIYKYDRKLIALLRDTEEDLERNIEQDKKQKSVPKRVSGRAQKGKRR